jgi:hypothetical protein
MELLFKLWPIAAILILIVVLLVMDWWKERVEKRKRDKNG